MTSSRLVRMANQIATCVPDQQAAGVQTASHLKSFWTPAMIDALAEEAVRDPESISEPVRAALGALRPGVGRG
jgi:hypothetical protein